MDGGAPWAWLDEVQRLLGPVVRKDAFNEADHPRDEDGKFTGVLGAAHAAVERLAAKYPLAKDLQVTSDDVTEFARHGGGKIYLSPKNWNEETLAKYAKEWDGLIVDPSVDGIITHEVGHGIANKIEQKLGHKKFWPIVYKHLGVGPKDKLEIWGHQAPSSYAQENVFEFLAETFVTYDSGGEKIEAGAFKEQARKVAMDLWTELLAEAEKPAKGAKRSRQDAAFIESDHPRDEGGQFTKGAGGGHKLSELTKVGKQLGSNPGGQYTTKEGKKLYVKQSKSNAHAKNEILASKLYEEAGAPILKAQKVDLGEGKLGTATDWQDVQLIDRHDPEHRAAAQEHFAAHAWLANWDAAGLEYDNQGLIDGVMTTLDPGGSLIFRAMGTPKGGAFGHEATEWDTLRDPSNYQAHRIFGEMTDDQLRRSAKRVAQVPDAVIAELVEREGPGTAEQRVVLAQKLIARKRYIMGRAGLEDAPPEETPGRARKDAAWDESKHPRDEAGKFTEGAGMPKAAIKVASMASTKKVTAQVQKLLELGALNTTKDVMDVAEDLKAYGGAYVYSSYAKYANDLLAHMEEQLGLKPGSLGKASSKKVEKAAVSAVPEEPPEEGPPSEAEMEKMAAAEAEPPAEEGWPNPTGKPQWDYLAHAQAEDIPLEQRISALENELGVSDVQPGDKAYIQQLVKKLKAQQVGAGPKEAEPSGPWPQTDLQTALMEAALTEGTSAEKLTAMQKVVDDAGLEAGDASFKFAQQWANSLYGGAGGKLAPALEKPAEEQPAGGIPQPTGLMANSEIAQGILAFAEMEHQSAANKADLISKYMAAEVKANKLTKGSPTWDYGQEVLKALIHQDMEEAKKPKAKKVSMMEVSDVVSSPTMGPEKALAWIEANEANLEEDAKEYAKDWKQVLQGVVAAAKKPAAGPAKPAIPAVPAGLSKVSDNMAKLIHQYAGMEGLSTEKKIASIEGVTSLTPAVNTYKAEVLAALKGGTAAPAAPGTLPPPPTEHQQHLYDVASGKTPPPVGKDVKEYLTAVAEGSMNPVTKDYANQLAAAQGGGTTTPLANEAKLKHLKTMAGASLPAAEKIANIQKFIAATNTEHTSVGEAAKQHITALTAELGPKPHAGSKGQQMIYDIAAAVPTDPQSALHDPAVKLKGIQEVMDDPAVTGTYTKQFGEAWIAAIKSTMPGAATPATKAAAPAKPSPAVITTTHAKRLERGQQAHAAAQKLPDAADPQAKVICKSLNRNWWKKVDPAQRNAVISYKGGSGSINGALREQETTPAPAHIQSEINHIDDLFEHEDAKLTQDVILRRGETVPDNVLQWWIDGLKAGKPVRPQRKGFVSTSMASQAAFSGNVIFEIVARKGTPAIGAWAADSSFESENEVLLRHGSVFEVYEIEKVGAKHIVRCMTM